jgi:hypothetical protein
VQLARKPRALLFLRIDQPSAKHVYGFFSLLPLDIHQAQAPAMHRQDNDEDRLDGEISRLGSQPARALRSKDDP